MQWDIHTIYPCVYMCWIFCVILGNCFFGRGRGYSGNISTTKSNKTCQRWSEQAPHQFILPSSQYPELAGDHNYCRNPGSRAPDGPWCFTTDPNTRWEYCDVPKCGKIFNPLLHFHISDVFILVYIQCNSKATCHTQVENTQLFGHKCKCASMTCTPTNTCS